MIKKQFKNSAGGCLSYFVSMSNKVSDSTVYETYDPGIEGNKDAANDLANEK